MSLLLNALSIFSGGEANLLRGFGFENGPFFCVSFWGEPEEPILESLRRYFFFDGVEFLREAFVVADDFSAVAVVPFLETLLLETSETRENYLNPSFVSMMVLSLSWEQLFVKTATIFTIIFPAWNDLSYSNQFLTA